MDVYGKNPTGEAGEYFRNNVWWWRPLAEYIITRHADLAGGCTHWHSNDGDGLDAAAAGELARRLRDDITSGRVRAYALERADYLASLPREHCDLCEGTGIRRDRVGRDSGQPERVLSPEVQILTGRTHGWCNACDGVGTREAWEASYPFDEKNVGEFALFLEECGGFSIC
jgi:hypothetical protein